MASESIFSTRYISTKSTVTFVRTMYSIDKAWRRWKIGGYDAAWEKAWGKWSREYTIPSSISSRKIRIRVWSPPNIEVSGLTPVHVNWAGSGYIIRDDYGNDSDFCQYLSEKLGITVLDCDYAKSPEYRYPHGPTDAQDVIRHIITTQPPSYDLSRITVGGFSAGGGLALGLAVNDDVELRKHIRAVVGVYPWVDTAGEMEPLKPFPEGSTSARLEPWIWSLFVQAYVAPPFNVQDPHISPARRSDADFINAFKDGTDGEKKLFIVSGELDNVTPQGRALVERLRKLDIDASFKEIKDVGHAWDKTHPPESPDVIKKEEAYSAIADFLRGVYSM